MWRNEQVLRFINWLKFYNDTQRKPEDKAGFYGLDLYSMYASIDAIMNYLEDIDPELADIAKNRYGCLTPYEHDPAAYGAAAMSKRFKECENEVVEMLQELLNNNFELMAQDGYRYHDAIQNARLVANAEQYYRSMYYGSRSSWNIRDSHMFETLEAELEYRGPNAKAIVWAHNSHVGDASATEMSARGEHNIGQLAKEKFGRDAYNIGFGTDHGTVAAASNWDGQMEVKKVRPSLPDSYEQLMNQTNMNNFMLPLHKEGHEALTKELMKARLERAIGVIYRPETELQSHYFQATLANQFDEYIWFNETNAVDALEIKTERKRRPTNVSFWSLITLRYWNYANPY